MKTQKWIKVAKLVVAGLVLQACSKTELLPEPTMGGSGTPEVQYQQIERLGRPAVNEGLVVTNDYLNAYNSIPPSADLSSAAGPVLAEAANTITSVQAAANAAYGVNVSGAPTVSQVVAGFIPDVMRIDTTVAFTTGQTAYNGCLSAGGMLCGGRKIKDDVIDITLSFLVVGDASGASIKDNVGYDGVAGNAGQPGHKAVLASFPYLAAPN